MDRTWLTGQSAWGQGDWGGGQDWAAPRSPFDSYSWASQMRAPYDLNSPYIGNNTSFDDRRIGGFQWPNYYPSTSQMMKWEMDDWLMKTYPELYDWSTGTVNPGGGGGNVSQDPSFAGGNFNKDPAVFGEIEEAAQKYGIPANLLKVMIARESSGNWGPTEAGTDNRSFVYLPSRGQRIVGYTGILESTAEAWGYNFDELIGNRALQIDAMANGLSRLYSQYGDQYGWDGVISVYYSGDPTQNYTPPDSVQHGTTRDYVADIKSWWKGQDDWTRANGGTVGGTATGGLSTPNTPEWQPINQWDNFVGEAARQYGVPPNLLKAMMRVESGGDPRAQSPAGATGLMQVMPGMHGLSASQLLDPRTNIMKGAEILKSNYDRWGTWEAAAQAYLGGTPGSGASDGFNTQDSYWNKINGYWQELDAASSGMFGGPEGDPGPVTSISAIWGGGDYPISQEHGPSDFARSRPGWYEYSYSLLGDLGHPGIDVAMPEGTKLFSPVGGTVVVAGPEGGYRIGANMDNYTPQTGELRIRMDNGHEVILGHMAGIHVTVGDRVQPGQYVGLSGYAGTGAHLHLEYRIPSTRFGGTQEAVDPRQALQGLFGGAFTGSDAGPGTRPMSYTDVLRAAARGEPTSWGMTLTQAGTYNSWLLAALRGEIPYVAPGQTSSDLQTSTGHYFRGSTAQNPFNALASSAISRS